MMFVDFRAFRPLAKSILAIALTIGLVAAASPMMQAQTIQSGTIQGTVTDPQGAVVPGAKVSIKNTGTNQTFNATTNSSGNFSSGSMVPGNYNVRVEAKGFQTTEMPVTVQVGLVSNANIKLTVGQESQVITVQASEVRVNTEQATVQGVLTGQQIDNLPVNGRNFLDLAQLEPGVQIQDGQNFDPTKVGYSSISFGGRFGRTARIEVDGIDVSDETVGTTTQDIPASGIQEFQISQSSMDLSTELTSSGSVNVVTRSGTNDFHGQGFYDYRDAGVGGAELPHPVINGTPIFGDYQRHQYGGRFGGPIMKDKLFFFMDAERTLQHLAAPVSYASTPFEALSGTFPSPFKEFEGQGRLDYQLTKTARLFARFNYFHNQAAGEFAINSYQVYNNLDWTRNEVVGADFNTGSFTHSIRFSYLKFQNIIADAVNGSSLLGSNIPGCPSTHPACLNIQIAPLAIGPNLLAPQSTPQSNHQLKYDGSKVKGAHLFRYGISYNHIQGGGFAGFFALAPLIASGIGSEVAAVAAAFPAGTGCANFGGKNVCSTANPLNYPLEFSEGSNGQGFSTEFPALGFPAGGLGPDNRLGIYFGDTWKIRPNLTLNAGLRWSHDTGRTDSDLPAIPALNAFIPGKGNPVRNPGSNFGPQLGIAWDPQNNGKTVIRAGIGVFFENVIYNNVLFDRPLRLTKGAFLNFQVFCNFGTPNVISVPSGTISPTDCTNAASPYPAATGFAGIPSIGQVVASQYAFEQQFISSSPFDPNAVNGSYLGNLLPAGVNIGPGAGLFDPNYRTPRSVQMNVGIQREIRPGTVFSADFVRNVTTHYLLGVDLNHTGDASHFNAAGALAAINNFNSAPTTAGGLGGACGPGATSLGASSQALVACEITTGPTIINPSTGGTACPPPACTMSTLAAFGLGSPVDFGSACPPPGCAFGGLNPNFGQVGMEEPIGRSVYNGLDVKLSQNIANPIRGIKHANFQIAYSLSRFVNSGAANPSTPPQNGVGNNDQDFVLAAPDNNRPNRYMGPSLLDRTHQLSFGGYFDVPWGFQLSMISHFYSPLSAGIVVPNSGLGAGEIFRTDFTGDGSTQDFLPGTSLGSFMRDVGPGGINGLISNYNNTIAGNPTPAGTTLVNSGAVTLAQLKALGAVPQPIPLAPAGQVGMDWLRAFDFTVAWNHKWERLTITPSVSIYNLFNFANHDVPPGALNGYLTGGVGFINGTNYNQHDFNRVGLGTGVFALGSPRAMEFGMKINF